MTGPALVSRACPRGPTRSDPRVGDVGILPAAFASLPLSLGLRESHLAANPAVMQKGSHLCQSWGVIRKV